mgnify:CR=1 FL=1
MGSTYTRQSTFTDGDTITADLFNTEFDQLVAAFAASSGHSHDGTAGEGGPIGGLITPGITLGDNTIDVTLTFDGGSNDGVLKWMEDEDYFEFSDDILIASTEKLQFRDTAIYINSSADGQLDLVADTEIQIAATTIDINGAADISGNLAVGGNLTVTGTTTFNGGTITLGDAAADNVVFGADVDSSIIPDDDDTYDLGSSSQQWRNLYIDGTAEIDTLAINGTTVTATAAELNIMDGVTATAAELNILDGVTSTAAELNILDGVTSTAAELNILDGVTSTASELNYSDTGASVGTVVASKVVTVDSNKDVASFRNITLTGELDAGSLDISGNADIDGTLETNALSINGTTVTATAAELNILDGKAFLDEDNFASNSATGIASQQSIKAYVDGVTTTSITSTGALNSGSITSGFGNIDTGSSTITTTGLISGGSLDIDNVLINGTTIGHTDDTDLITLANGVVTVAGEVSMTTLDIGGTNVTSTAAELNSLDGITAVVGELNALDLGSTAVGTAIASKAVVLDSNKDYTGIRNFTITGNLSVGGTTTVVDTVTMNAQNAVLFEGATADAHETTLTIVDPTADRTINLPNQSGTVPVLAAASNTAITSTPEELNILDGVTSTAAELNILDGVTSTAAELNILDGVTSTAAELNILDGVTATAAELNILDVSNTTIGDLSEISTAANDDVFIAVDTSGGGLKKITRSAIIAGTGSSGDLSNVAEDTSPQLGGNLDLNGNDIVTTSNATLDLAPNGTGTVVVRGNTNSGAVVFNCESNSHGQKVYGQPHSAGVTNTLMLPAGANSTLVSLVSTDTLTNKTLTSPKINEDVAVTSTATEINLLDGVTATTAELNILDGVTSTAAELNALDGITAVVGELNALDLGSTAVGTAIASKAMVLDSNKDYTGVRNFTLSGELDAGSLDISGNADIDGTLETDALSINGTTVTSTAAELNILDGVTSTAAELNALDGITAVVGELNALDLGSTAVGTAIASKAMILDSNKDYTGVRNFTLSGELDAGSLDVSGNVDVDGTLETDALSINGTAITSTAAELNLLDGVTATTAELNILDGVTSTAAELNILDGVTTTAAEINLIDGGTARGTTAVADGDGVLINDAGTMRMTSVDTLSTYMSGKSVGGSNIVTTGALNSGSITSGFGNIDTGSSTITTTGLISGGSLDIDNVLINGTTIGHTDDTDLITVADGLVTVAGEVQMTTLDIGGTNVTSTAAELNILDGVTSTATELNLLDGSSANSVVNSKAVIYGSSGELAGTLSTAAQTNVTSLGTLTALTVDDVAIDGKAMTMTGSSSDTAVFTVGTNGTLSIVTTDDAAAAANIQITADGTAELAGTTVTLDSGGDIDLAATNDVNLPANVGLTFGNDGEKIEGDGTNLAINSSGDLNVTATTIDIDGNVEISGTAVTTGVHTFTAVPVFPNNTVETADIQADAITGAKIADNAINSEHYTDGSIDTAHIADVNVTQGKIADQAINEAKMQISNSPTDGYFLSAQSGNTGGLTWAQAGSSTTAGDVGTYVLARRRTPYMSNNIASSGLEYGITYSGSVLRPSGFSSPTSVGANITWGDHDGSNLSGTYRAMGHAYDNTSGRLAMTLMVRTA